jgi:hypothetical protein
VIKKKIICLAAVMLSFLLMSALQAAEYPTLEMTNGLVHARIFLPQAESGYYRGTRFDWSGIMPDLSYNGHSYSGKWFDQYSPTRNDAVMGPAEAFDPLGYDEAPAGGSFVKIGIGVLSKPDASPYSPFKYYRILNAGKWKIKSSAGNIRFIHRLNDTSYAYRYEKELQLVKGKPELLLIHHLKNTGKKTIETEVFDHNFFLLDKRPMGPGLVLHFPFHLTAEQARGLDDIAVVRGDSITVLRQPAGHESVYATLHGYGQSDKDYDISLQNRITGTGVRMRCNRPLSQLVFWGSSTILCPEPYIRVKVLPGETFSWTIQYDFN